MKTLKETLEKFDENFLLDNSDYELMEKRGIFGGKELLENIKDFLSQSIQTALESVVVEKHCEDEIGWNDCREQLLENIEEYLSDSTVTRKNYKELKIIINPR